MITYLGHTEPGGHDENQDRVEVQAVSGGGDGFVCALADGQGGQAGAALAATIACQSCLTRASAFRLDQLLSLFIWPEILRQSDEAVADAENAGFTTLIGFCLTANALYGASSGDSAVAVLNAAEPPRILTKHQMKNPPAGSREAVFVPFTARLLSPWTVLAMTDGVWKYAGWDNILTAASEGAGGTIIHTLRKKGALPRTGQLQDDFTLAVFQA